MKRRGVKATAPSDFQVIERVKDFRRFKGGQGVDKYPALFLLVTYSSGPCPSISYMRICSRTLIAQSRPVVPSNILGSRRSVLRKASTLPPRS